MLGLENSTASIEELAIKVDNRVSIINYTLTKETEELKDGLTLVDDALHDTVEWVTAVEDAVSEIENRIGQLEVDGKFTVTVSTSPVATTFGIG